MNFSSNDDGWREFARGGISSATNIVLTFPLNKMIFRQQILGVGTVLALESLKRDGLGMLYRGMGPPLLQKSVSLSLMFGLYSEYFNYFRDTLDQGGFTVSDNSVGLCAAFFAGSTEAIMTPFERVQALLQDAKWHNKFKGTSHVMRALLVPSVASSTGIVMERHTMRSGIAEMYRGGSWIIARNGPSNVIFFGLRTPISENLPCGNSFVRDFVSGALLGATTSTIFYPFNVVKNNVQSNVGGRYLSMREAFTKVYNERNRSYRGLYLGVRANFFRSLASWGIINSVYGRLLEII